MGTFLTGYGDLSYAHGGYAGQVLDDGSLTGIYSPDTRPRMIGQVVAACSCGWAGEVRYPSCPTLFDEEAEALALAEWETAHARPVLALEHRIRVTRLQVLLRGLAGAYDHLHGTVGSQHVDLLDRTLRTLDKATRLTQELREQAEPGVRA